MPKLTKTEQEYPYYKVLIVQIKHDAEIVQMEKLMNEWHEKGYEAFGDIQIQHCNSSVMDVVQVMKRAML